MKLTFAIIIASLPISIGTTMLLMRINPDFNKLFFNKKYKKNLSILGVILGILIFLSFIIMNNIKFNVETTYAEFPIDKLTTKSIYYNNNLCNIDEINIIIEEPTPNFNNNIIIKTQKWDTYWLWKIPHESKTYYLFLSNDVYYKFYNNYIIFERKELNKK